MPNTSKKTVIYKPLLYAFLISLGILLGFELSNPDQFYIQRVDSDDSNSTRNGRVEEVLRFIESKYVDDIDADQLLGVALNSILEELDPHSAYIPPEQLHDVNQQMSGNYKGIGIETLKDGDTLVVVRIMEDGPASRTDLKLFDRIIEIDGENATDATHSYDMMEESLNNKSQSKTRLTILRGDANEKMEVSIQIDNVNVLSTNLAVLFQDSIAYVKIKQFNAKVYRDFNYALEKLDQDKIKHLIVDLRGNPGGYLPETAKIVSLFFEEKDKMLVYTEDKNQRKSEYKSNGSKFYNFDKIAIVVDAGSASGSEIMAGAVQDWDRGVIIGQPTYGKGLVQEQYSLKNGGALRLTVARYYTPAGRFIQKPYNSDMVDSVDYSSILLNRPLSNHVGIEPDITVDIPENCPLLLEQGPASTAYKVLKHKQWLTLHSADDIKRIRSLTALDIVESASDKSDIQINEHDPCIQEFVRKVKFQMIYLLFDEETALVETIYDDPYLTVALESISRKEQFVTSQRENLAPYKK